MKGVRRITNVTTIGEYLAVWGNLKRYCASKKGRTRIILAESGCVQRLVVKNVFLSFVPFFHMIWRLCVVALARGKVQPGKKIYSFGGYS